MKYGDVWCFLISTKKLLSRKLFLQPKTFPFYKINDISFVELLGKEGNCKQVSFNINFTFDGKFHSKGSNQSIFNFQCDGMTYSR